MGKRAVRNFSSTSDSNLEQANPSRLVALSWFLATLAALAALSWARGSLFKVNEHNYFHYLAHAFNQGAVHLIERPTTTHDLTVVDGKLFLYWGPVPAVLLAPFVAIFGISWPDSWVTLLLGALLSTLTLFLLRASTALYGRPGFRGFLLTAVFTFGSPLLPLALNGGVWATSQLFATTFLCAGICVALSPLGTRRILIASTLVGLACLSRPSMAGAAVWLLFRIYQNEKGSPFRRTGQKIGLALVVLGICVAAQLAYNYARFGDLFESGFSGQRVASVFQRNAILYGQLSFHNIPTNFYYHYIAYPFPITSETLWGGSLFLMTPLYIGAFWSVFRRGGPRGFELSLWVACGLIALPSLLVNGTGWAQLGPRYTLDYAPFLILLVSSGIQTWPKRLVLLTALVSVGHYLYGLFGKLLPRLL